MAKKLMVWLLAVCMFMGMLPESALLYPVQAAEEAGEGTMENPYRITTVEDMENLALDVASGKSGYYSLEADLDYSQVGFTPIGDADHPFLGTFLGNGYSIKGIKISGSSKYGGLFGYNKGTISNLVITSFEVKNSGTYTGVVAGYNEGTILRVSLEKGTLSGGDYTGGVTGYNQGILQEDVILDSTVTGTVQCGGIAGASEDLLQECGNSNTSVTGTTYAGGILGDAVAKSDCVIFGCYNTGHVHNDTGRSAGIVGRLNTDTVAQNCWNAGWITAGVKGDTTTTAMNLGGIAGTVRGTLQNCINTGNLLAYGGAAPFAGGICGGLEEETVAVDNCVNFGNVQVTAGSDELETYIGGLFGRGNFLGTATNCYSTGKVSGTNRQGGTVNAGSFAGRFKGSVRQCAVLKSQTSALGTGTLDTILELKEGELKAADFLNGLNTMADSLGFSSWVTYEKTYNGYPFPILSSEAYLAGISISAYPDKMDYQDGESFDPEGLTLEGFYSDGTTETLSTDLWTWSVDNTIVTVDYCGYQTSFEIVYSNSQVSESPLCAHFSFDGEIKDDSGNERGLYGSSSYNLGELEYVEGISGMAVGMASEITSDVSTHVIRLENNIIPEGATRYTISLWVKPRSLSNYKSAFFTNRTSQWLNMAPGGDRIDNANGTTNPSVWVYNMDGYDNPDISYNLKGEEQLPLNEWSMLTYTYAGGTACFYVNGKLADVQNEVVNALGGSAQAFYLLGNIYGDASFDGYVDELYLYQTELTAQEVAALYQEQRPEEKIQEKISVLTKPETLTCKKGDSFPKNKMKVGLYYYNQVSPDIISDYLVLGFDSTQVGTQNVILKYGDLVTSVEINVEKPGTIKIPSSATVRSLYIVEEPDKTAYYIGEKFDKTGMKVIALYSDGVAREITSYSTDSYSSILAGRQQVRAAVGDVVSNPIFVEILDSQDGIQGLEITSPLKKQTYCVGEALDLTGLQVTALYKNNGRREVSSGYLSVTGFDSKTTGTKTLTISYENQEITTQVKVVQKALTGIKVTRKPNTLVCYQGDTPNLAGMIVTAVYNNGETKVIKNYQVSASTKKPGKTKVTLSWKGKKTTVTVTVKKRTLTLKKSSLTILAGKTGKIQATVKPQASVTYKSRNTKVATVDKNGVVKGKKKGTAVILVEAGGQTKTCIVKVK